MPNRYPLWKYLLLVAALSGGAIYALPNVYPEEPAVQVSHASGQVGRASIERIRKLIGDGQVKAKAMERTAAGQLLIRFDRPEDQLAAAERIKEALGYRYVTALNPGAGDAALAAQPERDAG